MGLWACEWSASSVLGMLGHYLEPEKNSGDGEGRAEDGKNSEEQTCSLSKVATDRKQDSLFTLR